MVVHNAHGVRPTLFEKRSGKGVRVHGGGPRRHVHGIEPWVGLQVREDAERVSAVEIGHGTWGRDVGKQKECPHVFGTNYFSET